MKRLSLITAMALVALLVGACGPSEAPAPAPAPEPQTAQPVTPPQEEPAAEPATEEPAETPAEPTAATPSSSASIEGTTWEVGEFTLAFGPNSVVKVSGGAAADGIEAQYTLKEGGALEIIAPDGNTYPGTFDGTALKVSGPDGVAIDGKKLDSSASETPSSEASTAGNQAATGGGALGDLDDFDFSPGGGSASKRR